MIFNKNDEDRFPTLVTQKRIPTWNNLGRPKKVREGAFGFNLQTNKLEYWDGSKWLTLPMKKIK